MGLVLAPNTGDHKGRPYEGLRMFDRRGVGRRGDPCGRPSLCGEPTGENEPRPYEVLADPNQGAMHGDR